MKKKLAILLVGTMIASSILAGCGSKKSEPTKKETSGELKGDITFWHSFTQGPRMEVIQQTADQFMKDNPGVKIKIETFSWGDFYTKWTTGLASGNVPDMSTALPGHVVEMMDADALEPVDDLIDDIGRNKFSKTALSEGKKDGTCYSLPLYSHAQVMWYRKDLLQKAGLSVPKTWDEFAEAAKTLTKDGVYGCSFPCGSNDLMATRFLNFYVRSGGGSLLTDDLKANLTSDLAIDGINYWLDIYKNCSPKDSVNYAVLDQANLFYQGKTAFDFNSGFQISGVETNSPDLVDQIDCAPLPKINADDPDYGAETSNIPMVVWKNSKHPEICKAFMKKLYEKDTYIKFLDATPVGMLPSISGISDTPEYKENETVQKFSNAKKLINDGVIGKVLYCHSARNGWEEQQPTISWKKIREKSGGHLYHHIHELDCVQFLMGGMPEEVTMTGGNVAHQGEAFGDEDDMLFVNMQFSDNRYAVLEWGSAFHWPEHYVLIQGTKGAIKIDMCDCGGTLKIDGKDEHFLVHESQEEDDDRTRIYHSTEMDGAIMYGKPGKKPPMWLHSIMKNEMKYLNGILHGKEVDEEFRPLLTGEAARAAIATADACTRSRFEDRKVKLSEIIG